MNEPSAAISLTEDSLSCLLDDPDFETIHTRMDRFNLFEAVGAVRGELRHSNFLGYLLSPNRSHGLGDRPLKAVIRAILESIPESKRPVMTLELIVGDLADAIVYRERDNIDLLIELASLNLVVVIENKVDSKESEGQLDRYRLIAEERYPAYSKLYVYLTPTGANPNHAMYTTFDYSSLAKVFENLLPRITDQSDTAIIIRHYVEMLRRHIVPDERLKTLAAKLYERHSEALEFIFACRPQQGGVLEAIQDQIEAVSGLSIDSRGANVVRFSTEAWDQGLRSIRTDPSAWSRSGRALLFEVKTYANTPGRVNLALVLGPAEPERRLAFYEAARDWPSGLFSGLVKPMGQKWTTIFSKELLTSAQARGLTSLQQVNNVQLGWSDFQGRTLIPLINAILEIDERVSTSTI